MIADFNTALVLYTLKLFHFFTDNPCTISLSAITVYNVLNIHHIVISGKRIPHTYAFKQLENDSIQIISLLFVCWMLSSVQETFSCVLLMVGAHT